MRGKMDTQDTILDYITRKQLIRYEHFENGPNSIAKSYDQLEIWRKEKTRSSPKTLERWDIYSHEWKGYQNGRMERSKAMKDGRRKASPDVLNPRNIYIYIYICIYIIQKPLISELTFMWNFIMWITHSCGLSKHFRHTCTPATTKFSAINIKDS
jgi:hypothetical protein